MTTIIAYTTLQEAFAELNFLTMLIIIIVAIASVVVFIVNRLIVMRVKKATKQNLEVTNIMQHALDLSKLHVARFKTGTQEVFNIYGSLIREGGVSFDVFYDHVHPDHREHFIRLIEQLKNREIESGEYECLINCARNGQPERWLTIRCQAMVEGGSQPVNIICTMTNESEAVAEQQNERDLADKYRLIFDGSTIGLAFYDEDGMLLAANQYMRNMRHFQHEDDPFYFGTSLFNMPTYRDLLDRNHMEDLSFCTRAVVPERGVNVYVEARLHPIFDNSGKLLYISLATRDISEERDLYMQGKRNDAEIRRANEAIKMYENELKYLLENCQMLSWRLLYSTGIISFAKELSKPEIEMPLNEFLNYFIDREGQPKARTLDDVKQILSNQGTQLYKMHDLYGSGSTEWYIINNVPELDENGITIGQFGLIHNVTPLISTQEKLKEETERANDSGRQKSIFMANMTHEIRTPLNSIVGFSDLLPMIESKEDKQEMVRVIMNNCDMLLRLINDILEVSSMDSQAIVMNPKDVDFSKTFDDICMSLSERVQNPQVEFVSDNPYETCLTNLDPDRMQQVVTNFVTNAVKYTHQGHIRVGYRWQTENGTDGIYIYCEDTGTGIPKEKQERIFERFVKLNDYIQGTGLGLSICKAIADRCEGKIGIHSEGTGKGSTFWIWIPCTQKGTVER